MTGWGHNTRLSRQDVERAVFEYVQRKAAASGHSVPTDLLDFMAAGSVHFLDEANQPTTFARAVVAWED